MRCRCVDWLCRAKLLPSCRVCVCRLLYGLLDVCWTRRCLKLNRLCVGLCVRLSVRLRVRLALRFQQNEKLNLQTERERWIERKRAWRMVPCLVEVVEGVASVLHQSARREAKQTVNQNVCKIQRNRKLWHTISWVRLTCVLPSRSRLPSRSTSASSQIRASASCESGLNRKISRAAAPGASTREHVDACLHTVDEAVLLVERKRLLEARSLTRVDDPVHRDAWLFCR
jgi:hypothetical protein